MKRWGRRLGRPLVIAHRGDSARATENTVAAFLSAMAAGADGIELDVRLCASGEVVVFHDDDLWRLAGRADRVDGLSISTLQSIELEGGHRVPTLDEVYEVLGDDALVNVEIKSRGLGRARQLTTRVVECIDRYGAGPRTLISSFDPEVIARIRRVAPDLATGLLFHADQARPLRKAWLAPALRPVALNADQRLVDAAQLRRWHRRGYAVNVWTVDDLELVRELAEIGVDGIITNQPGPVIDALR